MATKKKTGSSKTMAEQPKRRPTKSVPPKNGADGGEKPVARRQSASVSVRPSARRAVVIGGVRTPFVRAFAEFMELDTIALAGEATRSLLERFDVPRSEIDGVVWGGVILNPYAPNTAREVALDLKLPHRVDGFTVTRACASGLQAVTSAVAAIERGEADVLIAGGSDSTSNAPLVLPNKAVHALAPLAFGKAKGMQDYLGVLSQLMPITDILPRKPEIAERTTGEVMGVSAERMAKRNGITREAQDRFALASHERAAAAVASGRFDEEIAAVETKRGRVAADTIVRGDTSLERLAKLKPAFDREHGTVTAGNASALTDGAAAVLIMSEEKARALGYKPKAAFRSFAYTAVDPSDQLLIGPAIAIPMALERAGLELEDASLVDIHEAFAAQVLSVLKVLGSDAWAEERLGRSKAVGEVDPAILNVHGGSVAIGHPFGATGARMVTTMANELVLRDAETAVLGICAAGGIGAAAVMERVD
jgi:acetyl-CoA acyltransferase